jgi:hypothetical protein
VVWRKQQTGALGPDAFAIRYGCYCSRCSRCGGRVGQSLRHDQEGGISIVREAGPRRGRQDPSRQDCCSRFAPEYGHPRRSVVYIPLCAAERLAHLPRKRQNEWRARQSERRFKSRRVGPVRPPPDRHARSHMQRRLLHLRVRRARGQRKDRQVLGRVVPLAAAPSRRVGSKSKHSQVHILRPRDRAHRE